MEDIRQDGILAFDTCFCNNRIRMLKVLVPLLQPPLQKYLALYIKYLEIRFIMECFNEPRLLQGSCFDPTSKQSAEVDTLQIFDQIIPFCSPKEKENLLHIRTLLDTFQNLKGMMEMMESMKELFPDGMNNMEDMASMFGMGEGFDPSMLSSLAGMFGGGSMNTSDAS